MACFEWFRFSAYMNGLVAVQMSILSLTEKKANTLSYLCLGSADNNKTDFFPKAFPIIYVAYLFMLFAF